MCLQMVCIWGCITTLVTFVLLFSTVCFQMSPQIACPRGSIVTLVAFVWLHDSLFLRDVPFLQTKVIIFKSLFHCQNVLGFAQLVVPNWVKSIIEFCFNFSMAYFHFLDKYKDKDTSRSCKKNVFMVTTPVPASLSHPIPCNVKNALRAKHMCCEEVFARTAQTWTRRWLRCHDHLF